MAGFGRLQMMEQVHLAGEEEEDIYGGFNDYNAALDTEVFGLSKIHCIMEKRKINIFPQSLSGIVANSGNNFVPGIQAFH
jgi:hypothetical protein